MSPSAGFALRWVRRRDVLVRTEWFDPDAVGVHVDHGQQAGPLVADGRTSVEDVVEAELAEPLVAAAGRLSSRAQEVVDEIPQPCGDLVG